MINELLIHKNHLTCIPETMNCADAVAILEKEGMRLAPVLDGSNTLFRGNIYRYHIYQYKYHHPEADLTKIPVTHFLKNTTKIVHDTDSIYGLFFAMSDLPYVAVLNEQNTFLGTISHNAMTRYFAQAWSMQTAGHVLNIRTIGKKGEYERLIKLIHRYSDINSLMSLDEADTNTFGSINFVLPNDLDQLKLNALIRDLNKRGYQTRHYRAN